MTGTLTALRVDRPWHFLRYLLVQQVAATADRDRALRRGDARTAADSILRSVSGEAKSAMGLAVRTSKAEIFFRCIG